MDFGRIAMDVGMLWFDNDNGADLATKLERAAKYYRKKYGQMPNLCFVNPCMLPTNGKALPLTHKGATFKTGNIEVRESKSMLPNHFWLGIQHQKAGTSAP
jgi:hypothetical protein